MKQARHDPQTEKLQVACSAADWPTVIRLSRQILRKNSRHLLAHRFLGYALSETGKVDAGLKAYHQAKTLWPDDAELLINYANVLIGQERPWEAVPLLEKVTKLRPEKSVCWAKLAQACYPLSQNKKGVDAAQKALDTATTDVERVNALTQLGIHNRELGNIREAVQSCTQALEIAPGFMVSHSNRLLFLLSDPESTPEELIAVAREFGNTFEPQFKPYWPKYEERRGDPWRRLKIGFLSPDFRKHAVMCFIEGVLAQLDRRQFEVHAFYTHPQEDNVTERVRCHVDHFIRIHDQGEEKRAATICEHEIDILFDMSGHTGHHSLMTLIRKPAPVQVSWVGFVATTGLTAIDYFLTDEVLNPPGAENFYTEKLFRINTYPATYRAHSRNPLWSYQPRYAVRSTPALHNGFITFGSCNNLGKLTDEVLALWGELLQQLPTARLLIEGKGFDNEDFCDGYRQRCARLGIDTERLTLIALDTNKQYLAYHDMDIALDPFPLTGGTTTLDTLWMGVPLVSMEGHSSPSRMSTDALTYMGRPEWLAKTKEEYLAIALGFASDIEQLNALRLSLRDEIEQSCLMRDDIACRHIADALRTMWLRWQAESEHPGDPEAQDAAVAAWQAARPAHLQEPPLPRVGIATGKSLTLHQAHARLQDMVERALAQDPGKTRQGTSHGMTQHWRAITEFAEQILSAVPNDPVALACLAEVENAHGHVEFAVTYLQYATRSIEINNARLAAATA